MPQEHRMATPDEKVVHQVEVWRDRDKEAIANPCDATKRAEYRARQQLREAADKLKKHSAAK